jgi:FAD/FMN-containing dehydrogenase
MNPHWGEQIAFRADNSVHISLVFQGLGHTEAEEVWRPMRDWLARRQSTFIPSSPIQVFALPARHFWDVDYLRRYAPGIMVADDRPGAPAHHAEWAGDQEQAGTFIHGYESAWLPARLLRDGHRAALVQALFAATRHFDVALHFNKGLAGAPAAEIAQARDTAMNPDVLDAFALAIVAADGASAYPGVAATPPDLQAARRDASAIGRAMTELRRVAPGAGSYVSESNFFQRDWQAAFWGSNHPRLAQVKKRYDPDGLFFVHHGVGSEEWSADGFTRIG